MNDGLYLAPIIKAILLLVELFAASVSAHTDMNYPHYVIAKLRPSLVVTYSCM